MSAIDDQGVNFAQKVLTSQDIQQNINLVEGRGIPQWWLANTKPSTLEQTRKDYLILNFPHNAVLRTVVLGLAWSFPVPTITAVEKEMPAEETLEEGDPQLAVKKAKRDAAKAAAIAERDKLNERIKELWQRRTWDGEKDFGSALPWNRFWLFVTGSTFFKLPTVIEGGKTVVLPERMPPEYSKLLVDKARVKVIAGFEFRYYVANDSEGFQDDPKGTFEVCERYYKGRWVVVRSPEVPEGKEEVLPWPFIPVAHMQWEERSLHPRGLPLLERLKAKYLHLLSVMVDRREAGKFAGSKMFVRTNAKGTLPPVKSGAVVDIKDSSPVQKAKFETLDVSTDDTTLRNEYLDAGRELYEEAFQPFPMDENSNAAAPASGKALRHQSKAELKYKEAFVRAEGPFLVDLFSKILTMEGDEVKPSDIRADYDLAVEPDPAERRADAIMYFTEGFTEEGLRSMGKEEDEIEEMMGDKMERQAGSLLTDKALNAGEVDPTTGLPKSKSGSAVVPVPPTPPKSE